MHVALPFLNWVYLTQIGINTWNALEPWKQLTVLVMDLKGLKPFLDGLSMAHLAVGKITVTY